MEEISVRRDPPCSLDVMLRMPEIERRTGRRRSSIYNDIKRGAFPRQVKLGERASGWYESEVQAWIASRANTRRAA